MALLEAIAARQQEFDYGKLRDARPQDPLFEEQRLRDRLRYWADGKLLVVVSRGKRGYERTVYRVGPRFEEAMRVAQSKQQDRASSEVAPDMTEQERRWREFRAQMELELEPDHASRFTHHAP